MKKGGIFTKNMYLELGLLFLLAQITFEVTQVGTTPGVVNINDIICSTCQCYTTRSADNMTEYFVNCSNKSMTKIPSNLPHNTKCLDLGNNQISQIANDTFHRDIYKNLTCLSLSNNLLTKIQDGAFVGLANLKMLDLSLNKIRYYDTSFDKRSFKPLTELVFLDIKQNFNNILPNETYPDEALSQIKKLQTLAVDGLYKQPLGEGFLALTNLQEMFFSGKYGRCNISTIDNSYFGNIRTAQNFSLFMSNCSLEYVGNVTFKHLTNLTALDISWNTNLTFNSLPNITYGLQYTQIKYLNLNSLFKYYQYDSCTTLQEDHLKFLQNSSLTIVTLESNNMVSVTNGLIEIWPRSVQYLSVRDNMLMLGNYIKGVSDSDILGRLRYFDMAQQFNLHVLPRTFNHTMNTNEYIKQSKTTHPNEIGINNTYFNHCCQSMFQNKKELNYFDEIINRVARLQPKQTSRTIHLQYIEDTSEANIANNIVNNMNSDNSNKSVLEYLDTSQNLPGTIPSPFIVFGNMSFLRELNISKNYLGYNIKNAPEFLGYLQLQTLKIIDLSYNEISSEQLMTNAFENLSSLEEIYLSNNRLKKSINIDHMTQLKYLNLETNVIHNLSISVRNSLDKLKQITINIADNDLACNCHNLDFLDWMDNSKVNFEDYDRYRCIFENGSQASLVKLITAQQLRRECYPPTFNTLILVMSLCLLAFIIIVGVGLAYRYKWNLRYLYYTTKFKFINGYQPIRTDDTEFEKDVFISYANEDAGFVRQQLLPQLEVIGNISLLVHDRDFQAGEYVADNIMNAVTSSRKTLVILTNAYLKRKWCLYEINMARLEGIETGRNVLCVMLKEEIPVGDLPLGIMDIIRKKTYLEYPQETEHLEGFWNRMRAAIK